MNTVGRIIEKEEEEGWVGRVIYCVTAQRKVPAQWILIPSCPSKEWVAYACHHAQSFAGTKLCSEGSRQTQFPPEGLSGG